MTNEEIKALLRELAQKAEAEGETRSKTVRITFEPKEKKKQQRPEEKKPKEKASKEALKKALQEAAKEAPSDPAGKRMILPEPLPEEAQEEEPSAFISVLPRKKEKAVAKRPKNGREGKANPQDMPEQDTPEQEEPKPEEPKPKEPGQEQSDLEAPAQTPDGGNEPRRKPGAGQRAGYSGKEQPKMRMPRMEADFESDAAAFTGDPFALAPESRAAQLIAGSLGGFAALLREKTAQSREKAAKRRAIEKAASEAEQAAARKKAEKAAEKEAEQAVGKEESAAEEALPENAIPEEVIPGKAIPEETKAGEAGQEASTDETSVEEAPDAAESEVTEPEAAEPEETEPEAAESEAAEPETRKSGAGGSDAAESETAGIEGSETGAEEESRGFFERLRDKGIAVRELVMIAAGAALLLLIAVMAINLIGNRPRGRSIEADEGLTVHVLTEPQAWASSGEVSLAIRTKSPIQSVSVNGEPRSFEGEGGRAAVSLVADRSELEVMVVCEDTVLTAATRLEWIDPDAPELTLAEEDGTVRLEAEDALSGVQAIYYGEITGFSNVPAYHVYTEPFPLEEGVVYSCMAQDEAGNVSAPVVTDFTAPEEIRFATQNVHLFPGESTYLAIETTPENAFVSNLTLTNSDGSVAALEKNGRVRALAEGTAKIQASVPGLQPASCNVDVREQAELTISAVGDLTLGEDETFNPATAFSAVYNANDSSYFFENVRSIFSADDITFGNLEGTLTTQGTREAKEYAFRGDPSYTQILTDGSIEAVTLANNHSKDYGEVSLSDTQKALEEAGIAWCYGDKIAYVEAEGVKTGLIGIYVLADGMERSAQVQSTIREARENGADLVVVAFHWGTEKSNTPDETQIALAHLAIDSGADLVVGHHPHVLQGIEQYQGKYIAYSLGNFCFGGNSNPSDTDTVIFQQSFRISQDQTITPGAINLIPCSVSSVSGQNNYQPTPASGTEQERIMNRMRELSEALGTQLQ